jgi:dethiobiotin synthetase
VNRYFMTGTDTGVGKTFVTAALASLARSLGQRVLAWKPIETGCVGLGEDQRELIEAAGGWQTGALAGVYQFDLAAAPLVSARAVGAEIDVAKLEAVYRAAPDVDLSLVEGAGGWRVPITESLDMGGFAKRLGLPVILVARAGLGTINHSLLSIEAIEREGCELAGVVLSRRPEDDPAFADSNRDEIQRRWAGRVIVLDTDPAILTPFVSRGT